MYEIFSPPLHTRDSPSYQIVVGTYSPANCRDYLICPALGLVSIDTCLIGQIVGWLFELISGFFVGKISTWLGYAVGLFHCFWVVCCGILSSRLFQTSANFAFCCQCQFCFRPKWLIVFAFLFAFFQMREFLLFFALGLAVLLKAPLNVLFAYNAYSRLTCRKKTKKKKCFIYLGKVRSRWAGIRLHSGQGSIHLGEPGHDLSPIGWVHIHAIDLKPLTGRI